MSNEIPSPDFERPDDNKSTKEFVMYKPIIENDRKFFMDGIWTIETEINELYILRNSSVLLEINRNIIDNYFLDNKIYSSRLKQGDTITLQTPEGYIDYFEIQSIDWKNSAYGTIYFKVS